jgi:hypothetical protein
MRRWGTKPFRRHPPQINVRGTYWAVAEQNGCTINVPQLLTSSRKHLMPSLARGCQPLSDHASSRAAERSGVGGVDTSVL